MHKCRRAKCQFVGRLAQAPGEIALVASAAEPAALQISSEASRPYSHLSGRAGDPGLLALTLALTLIIDSHYLPTISPLSQTKEVTVIKLNIPFFHLPMRLIPPVTR
jgi:hypothetical protein